MSLPTIKKQITNIKHFHDNGVTWVSNLSCLGKTRSNGDIFLHTDLGKDTVLFNIVLRHEIDHWCQYTFKEVTLEPPKEAFVQMLLQANGQPTSTYRNYVVDRMEWEVHLRDFLHLGCIQGMSREEILQSNFRLRGDPPPSLKFLQKDQFMIFRLLNFNNSLLQQIVDLWWED